MVGFLRATYLGRPGERNTNTADYTNTHTHTHTHTSRMMSMAGRWSLISTPQQLSSLRAQLAA